MKITAMKAQIKNPDRVSIYVDEKYAFSLDTSQLLEQKLRTGLEIDQARLAELKHLSDFGKAYFRALNYVMIRPRSVREVKDYARRKKWLPEDTEAIVEKLLARGYLNDQAFAKAWVANRKSGKSRSKRWLRQELKQKGIDEATINEVLEESSYSDEDALKAMVAKKIKLARYSNDPQKLMQYLARQGFDYDDIKRVMQQYLGG